MIANFSHKDFTIISVSQAVSLNLKPTPSKDPNLHVKLLSDTKKGKPSASDETDIQLNIIRNPGILFANFSYTIILCPPVSDSKIKPTQSQEPNLHGKLLDDTKIRKQSASDKTDVHPGTSIA